MYDEPTRHMPDTRPVIQPEGGRHRASGRAYRAEDNLLRRSRRSVRAETAVDGVNSAG
ncbi:hypothetical protein KEM60_01830 [Austwickia sp. TVS 96-490-7B]|nr:hypothetical protein [Austwickia sp. TVS 96-490-7B]